jgi:hypothetical protein
MSGTANLEKAHQASLALAMALHPRLGDASPLRMLPVDVIRRIALLYQLHATQWVVAISVRTGLLVDCISFHYSDGTDATFGGRGGQERPVFRLQPGEYIRKLRGLRGDYLDAIQFETNLSRSSAMYGGSGGKPFEAAPPEGQEVHSITAIQTKPWLTNVAPLGRRAPLPGWAEEIALLRLHGFATERSFICRPQISYRRAP